jgi:hypothetical protein
MSASVNWHGLRELEEAFRNMPEELATQAGREVLSAANGAAVTMRTEYGAHAVTGHLRDSVVVEVQEVGRAGVRARVRVKDPIAWIFDHGSQARHWANGKSTGRMPPTHTVARTASRARRSMYGRIVSMMRRFGLTVTGDA